MTLFLIFSALLGALVATFVGYSNHNRRYSKILAQLSALTISSFFAMLACLFPPQWVPFDSERGLVDVMIIVGYITVDIFYYYALLLCAVCGEELNYPAKVRKYRRQHNSWSTTNVVTVEEIARALTEFDIAEHEREMELMEDLANGIIWIDLDADEDALDLLTSPTIEIPAIAEAEPTVEIITADEITVEPTVPLETETAELIALIQRIEDEEEAVERFVQNMEAEDAAKRRFAKTMDDLTRELTAEDTALVVAAFQNQPMLVQLLESDQFRSTLTIAGKGAERHVRVGGVRHISKRAVV